VTDDDPGRVTFDPFDSEEPTVGELDAVAVKGAFVDEIGFALEREFNHVGHIPSQEVATVGWVAV